MDREQKEPLQESVKVEEETVEIASQEKTPRSSAFESIYDQLPDIPVKAVDRFIIICIIALIAVVLVGILKARHVI